MLRDVLTAINGARGIVAGLVIHADPIVERLAIDMGMQAVLEATGMRDLNTALVQGLEILGDRGADAVLILPGDVPLVDAESIEKVLAASSHSPGITICPSLDEDGTNALLVRPIGATRPSFGPGSFERHKQEARSVGNSVTVIRLSSLALDIDEPRDLDRFLRTGTPTHASTVLRDLVSR